MNFYHEEFARKRVCDINGGLHTRYWHFIKIVITSSILSSIPLVLYRVLFSRELIYATETTPTRRNGVMYIRFVRNLFFFHSLVSPLSIFFSTSAGSTVYDISLFVPIEHILFVQVHSSKVLFHIFYQRLF